MVCVLPDGTSNDNDDPLDTDMYGKDFDVYHHYSRDAKGEGE